jgi:hypothetical protein
MSLHLARSLTWMYPSGCRTARSLPRSRPPAICSFVAPWCTRLGTSAL